MGTTTEHSVSTGKPYVGGHVALACALAGLGAFLCLLLTAIDTLVTESLVRNQIRQRLRDVVAVAASRIDGDLHNTLTRPEQEGGPDYRSIQRVLQQVKRAVPTAYYVYTMRQQGDGSIMFVVDEETNEMEVAHLGDIYDDAGPALLAHVATMDAPVVENDIYTDRWGSWLSGYAPFYDSNGGRAGIIGMDINADDIAAARRRVLRINLGLFAAILPVCGLLGWFLADRLIVPVRKMAREAEDILGWPGSHLAPGSRVAELAAVSNALRTMRHLLEGMSDAVVATDMDGRVVYVNHAACAALQKPRENLLGQPVAVFGEDPVHGAKQSDILRAALDSGHWEGEVVNIAADGRDIVFDSRVRLLRDSEGVPMGLLGVSTNITERRRAEAEKAAVELQLQQARRLELVGQLAGGIAHDFNNLVMGIMGYADLGRDAIDDDHPARECLDQITKAAKRSADLTRQLLAFARKQTIVPQVLDLNDNVAGILNMLRRLIGESIKLTWQPEAGLWPINMDPSQIDQLLANLCVNARDAIAGVGTIAIKTANATLDADACALHADALPGDYVVLSVSDTGHGMDSETLEHAFEPFFTTKPRGKGTGMGLATVHGIVKQNGGHIVVRSEPGQGTTFRIYLPRHRGDPVETARENTVGRAPARGKETVLLVEDEPAIRVTTAAFLRKLGYNVLEAEGPQTALDLAARHPGQIHILVTDVVMPDMTGQELAKRLAARIPGISILYMSGYTAEAIADDGVLDQGVHFLAKPFTRDVLAAKLRDILS